jgi:hypothetical protein
MSTGIARAMEEIVEIEESGLALVVSVEGSERFEFAYKSRQRSRGDIRRESLVRVAAAVALSPTAKAKSRCLLPSGAWLSDFAGAGRQARWERNRIS